MRGMIKKLTPHRHSDKTTNVSLYYLRAQIIRDGLEGLEHVDALLRLRGIDPDALRVPEKKNWTYRRGGLTVAVLGVLRQGANTAPQIAAALDHRHSSVCQCLATLEARGVVRREGRVWRLAIQVDRVESDC